jgi:hypothetical protein
MGVAKHDDELLTEINSIKKISGLKFDPKVNFEVKHFTVVFLRASGEYL